MDRFERGGEPWIRSHPREDEDLRCPFCGSETLMLSVDDVREDDLRIELYCDNSDCDVREMTILAMRIGEPNHRADVRALQAIDTQGDPQQGKLERRRRDGQFTLDVP